MEPRLHHVLARIDAANSEDPRRETADGRDFPREVLYSRRMSEQLRALEPNASEALQIAARAQHIRRWQIPRADYPAGRAGYLRWRIDLGRFHAQQTAALMAEAGYDPETVRQVRKLLTKRDLHKDQEVQTLEDAICLVFLRFYLEDFASGHDEDKVVSIIRKTWKKMSPRGREAASRLNRPGTLQSLMDKALRD